MPDCRRSRDNADVNLLEEVLNNPLGNAWKYTVRKDKAVIEFGVMEISGKLVYFVRDNGVGFDMNEADKLFPPFQRLTGVEDAKLRHWIGYCAADHPPPWGAGVG